MSHSLKAVLYELLPPIITGNVRNFQSRQYRASDAHIRSDGYIHWLCTVVGGWLTPNHGNLRAFDYAIEHLPPEGAVVEVGSFLGLSTNILIYLLVKYGKNQPVFNCDPWLFEETDQLIGGFFDASTQDYQRYAKEVFKQNCLTFSAQRKPYAIEALSQHFFEQWHRGTNAEDVFGRSVTLGGPISFAYIDGAHTYEATRQDFLDVHEHLSPGGFILFDDSADGIGFGATQAALEVKQRPEYELVFKTPHYFFRRTG